MSKYIKLEDAIRAVDNYYMKEWEKVASGLFSDLPTIEIVRCKECIYYTPFDKSRPFDCPIGVVNAMTTDFCSHGERMESDTE